ncbi:SUMF1/EgtB/PvdO family nonheme iron enzyme [Rubritalea marina]|uniref:SUMF1/EgtB/PvdO family nonheme iron enzyme n=1 Tax=Rubritalea marina TaxID=361055 RepID=UPI000369BFF5|nr:SUMF1/EgtB/PvdO family nonheme iron enzyme [Rubritalea marina]
MTTNPRLNVHIPDHEVLRKIGGGAYGEVWMARSVTGALRAVKVVWREDFDDERGFEREFDGILQYEPLSRDHPGLVNILHVGRSKEGQEPFYYYVMELGDDYLTGIEINPVEYEARTLRSDVLHAEGQPLAVDACLDVASRLGDALQQLHANGLAHRDVKPSNVIFVDGKAKLADIGLVAPRDQRTFVGTEGFVPPEGPGSAQADLYSLGKVLYEMVSGKDRLQFPELPDELPSGDERKQWLALNQVICDICEPRQSKREIQTASQFVHAIERIQAGKRVSKRRSAMLVRSVAALLVIGLAGFGAYSMFPGKGELEGEKAVIVAPVDPSPGPELIDYEYCAVRVTSLPQHAEVYENGVRIHGVTPTEFRDFMPGDEVSYRFEKVGYKPLEKTYTIPNQASFLIFEQLQVFRPPVENLMWKGPFSVNYTPQGEEHVSGLLHMVHYKRFLKATGEDDLGRYATISENGEKIKIALLQPEQAQRYIEWLEGRARAEGLIEDKHMLTFKSDPDLKATGYTEVMNAQGFAPIRSVVKKIPYASIELTSIPGGARVYVNGNFQGLTPILLSELRPKSLEVEIREDGFKKFSQVVTLKDYEEFQLNAVLEANHGVVFGEPWRNSLGMEFVPINPSMMGGAYEVRVKDYLKFCKEANHRAPYYSRAPNLEDHPIVNITRDEAEAFCVWLTQVERQSDTISEAHRYSLPTDLQWSEMVGFEEDAELSPLERDLEAHSDPSISERFFWGDVFPPLEAVINIADEAAGLSVHTPKDRTIDGYYDGYAQTAPVGSFGANDLGLYDMGGNVSEWVAEDYDDSGELALTRGGSWTTFFPRHLRVWSRSVMPRGQRSSDVGFRIVLLDEEETLDPELGNVDAVEAGADSEE